MDLLRSYLVQRLPFYYGWIVFAIVAGTNYAARPLMSVSVLSVFMLPLTETFGWSRGLLSGMAKAGVSLHQVSYYIQQGLTRPAAAVMASIFAIAQVPAGLLWSTLTRRYPLHYVLALAGLAVAVGAAGTAGSSTLTSGSVASAILGGGVGGLHMLLRLAWAEYYGRHHLGTIQGVTLPVQLVGQALGPVTAGLIFDVTGTHYQAFLGFAGVVLLGSACVLTATPPRSSEAL